MCSTTRSIDVAQPALLSVLLCAAANVTSRNKDRRPTFIELGAFDGVSHSNTLLLEACHGWNGVLIEGNPVNFAKLEKAHRRASLVHSAITTACPPGNVINYTKAGGEVSGLTIAQNCAKHHHSICDRVKPWVQVPVPCSTLSSVLTRVGVAEEVDFFSLDVEGHELSVLRSLDDRSILKVVVAEADSNGSEKDAMVASLLREAGLHRVHALERPSERGPPRNHVYLRHDVERRCWRA